MRLSDVARSDAEIFDSYARGLTFTALQIAPDPVTVGIYRTEVRLPATLPGGAAYTWYPAGDQTPMVNGLTLVPGQVLGLNVTMSNFAGSNGGEFAGTWTSLFEIHSYVDFQLGETTGAPETPATAGSPGLYLANPYVRNSEIVLRTGPSRTAEVALYDVLGRKVRILFEGQIGDDGLRLRWDGTTTSAAEAPPGVYYLRAAVGRSGMQRKVVWLGK